VNSELELRPLVRKFAETMERKLRENEYKSIWKNESANWLLDRLREEVEELDRAIYRPDWKCHVDKPENQRRCEMRSDVWREAADVANFAMMVADVYNPTMRVSE